MMNGGNNDAGRSSSSHGNGSDVNAQTNQGVSPNPLPSPQFQPAPGTTPVGPSGPPLNMIRTTDLLVSVSIGAPGYKAKLVELARKAMLELDMKVHAGEPLWKFDADRLTDVLDEIEYVREFLAFDASIKDLMRLIQKEQVSSVDGSTLNGKFDEAGFTYRTEASRCIGFVKVNAGYLADMLMDYNRWCSIFCGIISRPAFLGAVHMGSPETSGDHEALQLVRACYQMATPLVSVRDCLFLRYKKQISPGVWGVVEVSVEKVFPHKETELRRRASGCLIFDMLDGSSKVAWVEHVEINESNVNRLLKPFVFSGLAFSAHRYVAGLVRYCDLLSTIFLVRAPIMLGGQLEISQRGKESLLSLSQRMVRIFFHNISLAHGNNWVCMPCEEDNKMKIDKIVMADGSHRTYLAFSTSVFVPVRPHVVFEFLRDCKNRIQWDVVSREHEIQEIACIVPGGVPESRVSIIETKLSADLNKKEVALYLQESFTDGTGLYVVHAPVDERTMAMVLNGGNSDVVRILPSAFVVHPDRPILIDGDKRLCFSVVTIALNILDDASNEHQIQPKSIDLARNILKETGRKIYAGLFPPQPEFDDDDDDEDSDDDDDEDSDDDDEEDSDDEDEDDDDDDEDEDAQ